MRVDGLFRYIGDPLDGQEKPYGERNGSKYAGPAMRQCIDPEVIHRYGGPGGEKEKDQTKNGQDGDKQFKGGGGLNAIDVQGSEYQVSTNGNGQNGYGGKKEVQVGPDGKGNGRWGKNKLDVLGHAGKESALFAQRLMGVIKRASRFGYGTGHFRVTKGKGQVHNDDKPGGDGQAQGSPLFQAEVPSEVHAGDDIADAKSPQHDGSQFAFEMGGGS